MGWDTVLLEKVDNIARITLNRPGKRNAQNMRLISELDQAFKAAERDSDVRVVILCGAGPAFSSGHDLSTWSSARNDDIIDVKELRCTPEGVMRLEQEMYLEKCLAIRNLSKPTIAQIHGACIAAGMMIAAMCDIIYASEDATFSDPVLRMAAASVEVLFEPWDMGARRAKEFLFTAGSISAQEAYRLGFVNKVVPSEMLADEVMDLARRISLTPPTSLSLTKASINHTLDTMGQTNSWMHHLMVHVFSHHTHEAQRFKEMRAKAGDLKSQFNYQKGEILP